VGTLAPTFEIMRLQHFFKVCDWVWNALPPLQELKCIQDVEWWLDRADFYDESAPPFPTFQISSSTLYLCACTFQGGSCL